MESRSSTPAQNIKPKFIYNDAINKYGLILADVAALLVAGLAANFVFWFYNGLGREELFALWTGESGTTRVALFAAWIAFAIGWFWLLGHYTRRRPFWDEIGETVRVVVVLALLDAALQYLAKLQFSRFWFLGIWATAVMLIPLARLTARRLLIKAGVWPRPTVILGTGPNALEALAALRCEPLMGLDVVAFVATQQPDGTDGTYIDAQGRRYPLVPLSSTPEATLLRLGKPVIVIALEQEEMDQELRLIASLHRHSADVRVVLPIRGLPLYGATVHHLFRHELFFLTLRNNLARRAPRLLKRAFDIVVSAGLLVLLSPFFAYLAWAIRKDGGPVLFFHTRIGRHGKPFPCIKFRTMVPDADGVLQRLLDSDPTARTEWNRDFKLKYDPRITKIGSFLRAYSLDELPQLWNVLTGDMSLVGPRPIVAQELERYGDNVDYYLDMHPGMTGLWQISGRNDTDYSYRVYLDTWYVKNWSLWYDIVILIRTVRVVIAKQGAY